MIKLAGILSQSKEGGVAPPVLGPELISNGGFDNTNNWSAQAGWVISGGTASITNAASSTDSVLEQNTTASQNKTYRIKVDAVGDYSGGGLNVYLGGPIRTKYTIKSDGSHEFDVVNTNTVGTFGFRITPDNSFEGSVDNVSMKEVLNP